jgi:oxalate decarboxylase/phosphoglucose isomerase-like protein (cupin superfamily)
VFMPVGSARTMDFNANDVGFVPANAGHYVENTGDTDLVFLELFKASEVVDFSLNQWIRRVPPEMVYSHLKLDKIRSKPFLQKSWTSCRDSSSLANPGWQVSFSER